MGQGACRYFGIGAGEAVAVSRASRPDGTDRQDGPRRHTTHDEALDARPDQKTHSRGGARSCLVLDLASSCCIGKDRPEGRFIARDDDEEERGSDATTAAQAAIPTSTSAT